MTMLMNAQTEHPLVLINEIACSIHSHDNATELDHFDSVEQYKTTITLCRINVLIWNIIPPIFLVAGTLGNVLSIVIWSQKKMRKQTQHLNIILIWLAIGDLLVLYTGISRHFLRKASYIQWDVQKISLFLCKFHEFLVYFSLSFSAWIIAFIAVERCICVVCVNSHVLRVFGCNMRRRSAPSSACPKLQCVRPQSLYAVIALIIFACTMVNCHFFWTRTLVNDECRNNRADIPFFLDHVWPKLDLLFTSVLPCALILISTVLLSIAVCCCHPTSLHSVNNSNISSSAPVRRSESRLTSRSQHSQSVVNRKSNKITWTLIGILLVFVLCVCPTRIFLVIYPLRMPASARYQPLEFFKYRSIWALLLMIEYLTYVINFMVYSLSNERFRREARKLFCKEKVRLRHFSTTSLRNIPVTTTLLNE